MTDEYTVTEPNDSDYFLIQAMANGSVHALDELYARRGPGILSYLTMLLDDRQLAEEVLQDVMLAAWKNAATFRGESSVRTWLLVIARNRAMNTQRKRHVAQIPMNETFESPSQDTGPLESLLRKATHSAIREAINLLPNAQREVLVLVFYHQLSGQETADVLGITVGTVKSRLHRAKETLRGLLHSEGVL